MKNLILIIITISFCLNLNSQDLHIFYDVAKDTIIYEFQNEFIDYEQVNLKKNRQAILHITNYNDYLYDVEIKSDQSVNFTIPSAGTEALFQSGNSKAAFDQLKDLANPFGSSLTMKESIAAEKEKDGFGDADVATYSMEEKKRQEAIQVQLVKYEQTLQEMDKKINTINALGFRIEKSLQGKKINAMVTDELETLRYHPGLSPEKIRMLSMEYMETVLRVSEKSDPNALTLGNLINQADEDSDLSGDILDYQEKVGELEGDLMALKTSKEVLKVLSLAQTLQVPIETSYLNAENSVNKFKGNAQKLSSKADTVADVSLKSLISIRYLYEEMKEHKFEKTYTINSDADLKVLNVTLKPNEKGLASGATTKSLNTIQIPVYGGIKVNASIGLSFASYFDQPEQFFTRDSVILSEELDPFSPIITSFFHFYSQGKRQVTVGGTFGLGVGLGGETGGLQTYFFGPSLIMGKTQRVVLSTGLTAGKVSRLGGGFEVGDIYTEEDPPTKSVYDLGYFFGISFNILNSGN